MQSLESDCGVAVLKTILHQNKLKPNLFSLFSDIQNL